MENLRLNALEKEAAVSQERSFLARELHDSIAQSLAFLKIQVQLMQDAFNQQDPLQAQRVLAEIDTGVREGDTITPYYDPMLAKIICHAPTRAAVLAKMTLALAATQVEGIWTNVEFLRRIIAHPAFERGEVFTGFIDAHKADLLA